MEKLKLSNVTLFFITVMSQFKEITIYYEEIPNYQKNTGFKTSDTQLIEKLADLHN